jgi:isoleucyl-tRNA synthetase
VVRAEPLRFKEEDVLGMIKRVFLPWINAFRFFQQGVARLEMEKGTIFTPSPERVRASTNVMDVWIQASLQGMIKFVHDEMAAYRLYTVTPRLLRFIEELTNWCVERAGTSTFLVPLFFYFLVHCSRLHALTLYISPVG